MRSLPLATFVVSLIAFASAADPYGQCAGEGYEASPCPDGFKCHEINTVYSHCIPEDDDSHYMDPTAEETHDLRKRQSNTLVRGPTTGGVQNRLPIHILERNYPLRFNGFMTGLYDIMRRSEGDILSYYQISGIHGAPFRAWAESQPSNPPQLGYCTHASALFATWHRPYLSLLEQRISAHAVAVASRFTGSRAADLRAGAANARLAYWDWSNNDLRGAVPSILTRETISLTFPDPNTGAPVVRTVANPLRSYRFTSTRKNSDFRDARIRSAAMTLRQPPASMTSSNNGAFDSRMRGSFTSRRQNTYNLFAITNFNQFSNRAWNGGNPGQFVSVESVHDEVHVNAGGSFGHMSFVEYSSFDPVFWMHHCNIDRLVAMYQAARPGLVVQPQQMSPTFSRPNFNPNGRDTIDTPLNPFRKASGSYFTSRDVSSASSIWNYNYDYPEVPVRYRNRPSSELSAYTRGEVARLYGPNTASARKRSIISNRANEETAPPRREWLVFIKFNTKEFKGDGRILFFLDPMSPDLAVRLTQSIGTASAFASESMEMDKDVTHTVPLTELLLQRGIDLSLESVVPYLKENLSWSIIYEDREIPASSIPSLFIGVSSTNTKYVDGLPVFGEWELSADITEKIPGGFTKADDAVVDGRLAKVIPAVGEVADKVLDAIKDKPKGDTRGRAGDLLTDLIQAKGDEKVADPSSEEESKGTDGEDVD